jgi:hypothetical protein
MSTVFTLTGASPAAAARTSASRASPDPVGGERDLGPRAQCRRACHDAGQAAAQQRPAAGKADLGDTEPMRGMES